MKMLICQAPHEDKLECLEKLVARNTTVSYFLFPEGYINNTDAFNRAKKLARAYSVTIITSLKIDSKDVAVIIDSLGETVYKRLKTRNADEIKLTNPFYYHDVSNNKKIGFLLCMEILKGNRDLPDVAYDFIVHPIGVGMYSEEQLELWLKEAKKIARKYHTMIIGVSHSDGSYKNCGVSIPLSYCIDKKGEIIYLLKNDLKTKLIDVDFTSEK